MFWGGILFLLNMCRGRFSLYMLRFELRTHNDNTVYLVGGHWPKLIHFLMKNKHCGTFHINQFLKEPVRAKHDFSN